MRTHLLSIVVPAYNEAVRIESGELDGLIEFLMKSTYSWELILVDDGSSDQTPDLVEILVSKTPNVRLIKTPHQGKGFALLAGMKAATGKYILFTDLDQATPIQEFDRLQHWFEQGYDVVVGTRGISRSQTPFSRKCVSYGYMLLRTLIIGFLPPIDSQCGFKAFTCEALQEIIKNLHVYHYDNRGTVQGHMVTPGFDVELLVVARQLGYSTKSVPVSWKYHHCGSMNIVTASKQGFIDLIRIRSALKRGKYDFSR